MQTAVFFFIYVREEGGERGGQMNFSPCNRGNFVTKDSVCYSVCSSLYNRGGKWCDLSRAVLVTSLAHLLEWDFCRAIKVHIALKLF